MAASNSSHVAEHNVVRSFMGSVAARLRKGRARFSLPLQVLVLNARHSWDIAVPGSGRVCSLHLTISGLDAVDEICG
jgi:hypothetical protein